MMFVVVPLIIVGAIIFAVIKGITDYTNNSAQPLLYTPATVVAKRTEVHGGSSDSMSHNQNHMHTQTHIRTTYFATFQLTNGERKELRLDGNEYGLLVEGDVGDLGFQGDWYKGFQRRI